MTERDRQIRRLYRERPRSRFLRWSAVGVGALVVTTWTTGGFAWGDLLAARRIANLKRFLGELRPYPLQNERFEIGTAAEWVWGLLMNRGFEAAGITLALAVAAMVFAAFGAAILAPVAARTISSPEPFSPAGGSPSPPGRRRWSWRVLVWAGRGLLVLMRSVPEYVLAFLFLAIFGATAWPIVLALALHNAGILGKLQAEVIENLDPTPLATLRDQGASRAQILLFAVFPLTFSRFLLFFFYRWETCVREATVLGMLGIASLGYWIVDARARNHYDELFLWVLVGATLVLVGDAVSALTREWVRRGGG